MSIKTHTGIIITNDGEKRVKLRETPTTWCVGPKETYRKEDGRRCGAPLSRRRLLLSTIKPIGQVEQPTTPVTKISDKSLANLIADADKVLERNTPVADEEWWQDFRAAMLELQERRRAGIIPVTQEAKEHQVRELVNKLRDVAIKYHGTQQLRAHIVKTVIRSGLVCGGAISE
ncbi:hypothetical protein [Escherichia coli]|uniref:hypothetical protein n=1 Tax=Escherichia coli TaxID=562 RepID=UPI003CE76EE8